MSLMTEPPNYTALSQNEQDNDFSQVRHESRPPRKPLPTTHKAEPVTNAAGTSNEQTENRRRVRPRGRLTVWRVELACCVLFLAAFIAIIATLLSFEHRRLPQWKYGLSLNTLVSIYVIMLRASMLLVISQCLGQLKWLWFRHEHQLLDFARYDEASRGPLGAFKLLWRLRVKDLTACLGALVTVAALVIDPFAQQVVATENCTAEIQPATARLNRANVYIKEYYGGASGSIADLAMQKAINAGIYNPGSSPPFQCDTGNCTFATPYSTLGYCSKCTDMTSQLVYSVLNSTYLPYPQWTNTNYTWSLPPDEDGEIYSAYINSQENSVPFSMTSARNIVAAFTSNGSNIEIGIEQDHGLGPVGARCSLTPCIRTYTATVTNFTLEETILSTSSCGYSDARVDPTCLESLTATQLASIQLQGGNSTDWPALTDVTVSSNGTWYFDNNASTAKTITDVIPRNCIYGFNFEAWNALDHFLSTFLSGNITTAGSSDLWDIYGSAVPLTIYNMSAVTFESIDAAFRNVSDSITTQIRVDNSRGYYSGVGVPSDQVTGQTWENRTCVRVRWAFLTYPATMIVLAVVFFIATILSQDGDVAVDWKSSQMALLFHGLNQRTLGELGERDDLGDAHGMENVARDMSVSLRWTGSRICLTDAKRDTY